LIPDVNVLVAAARSDHTHHAQAHDWLVATLAAGREVVLPLLLRQGVGFWASLSIAMLCTVLAYVALFALLRYAGVKL
jgi:predicted nucleic acid-binding protein